MNYTLHKELDDIAKEQYYTLQKWAQNTGFNYKAHAKPSLNCYEVTLTIPNFCYDKEVIVNVLCDIGRSDKNLDKNDTCNITRYFFRVSTELTLYNQSIDKVIEYVERADIREQAELKFRESITTEFRECAVSVLAYSAHDQLITMAMDRLKIVYETIELINGTNNVEIAASSYIHKINDYMFKWYNTRPFIDLQRKI